jgi:Domain of unknown function (DUF4338)
MSPDSNAIDRPSRIGPYEVHPLANCFPMMAADQFKDFLKDVEQQGQQTPVVLFQIVQRPRFPGTAYRAANWRCVGLTKGRGKLEEHHQAILPTKAIFLYPLRPDFKEILTR